MSVDISQLTDEQLIEQVQQYQAAVQTLTNEINQLDAKLPKLRKQYEELKIFLGIEGEYDLGEDEN